MKRFGSLVMCLLMLLMMALPVTAEPEDVTQTEETQVDDGFDHLSVNLDYVIDANTKQAVVGLKDENGGSVEGGNVYLEVDGEQLGNFVLANGSDERVAGAVALIDLSVVPETAATVSIVFKSYTWSTTLFEEARADITTQAFEVLGYTLQTTTEAPAPETTQAPVTEMTQPPVVDATAPTASVSGERAQLLVEVDQVLADQFGFSKSELEARIKANISIEDYNHLVGTSGATAKLVLTYDGMRSADRSAFVDAKNNNEHYKNYADESVYGEVFTTTLVLGDTPADIDISYEIYMVIPSSMQNSGEVAIAAYGENGLEAFSMLNPNNGAFVGELYSSKSYAIVCFGEKTDVVFEKPTVWGAIVNVFSTWQTAVCFVVGVLFLLGGIVFIIVCIIRRVKSNDEEEIVEKTVSAPVTPKTTWEAPKPARQVRTAQPSDKAPVQTKPVENKAPAVKEPVQPKTEKKTTPVKPQVNLAATVTAPQGEMDAETFGRISERSVTPAKNVSRQQTPRSAAKSNYSVDDLLDELSDLQNMNQ